MYDRGIAGRLDDWTLWVQSLEAKGIFTSDRNEGVGPMKVSDSSEGEGGEVAANKDGESGSGCH